MLFYIIIEKKCQMNLFEEFSTFAMSENLCKFRKKIMVKKCPLGKK